MTAPKIEHRVGALARRVTRVEEDLEAVTDTVYAIHRRVTRVELGVAALLDHFGLARPSDADVDAALDDELTEES
jgi:hypothetical protein